MSRLFNGSEGNYLQAAFDGITAYPFSLSWFHKYDGVAETQTPVSLGSSTTAKDSVRLKIAGTVANHPGYAELYDNDTLIEQTTGPNLQTVTAWKHFAIVVTATELNLWVDGTEYSEANSSAFSLINGLDRIVVGNWKKTNTFYANGFNGLIAEVSLWALELSAQNVADLVALKSPLDTTPFPTGPIDYWRLKGSESPEPNEIGGGNDLAMTGSVTAGGSDPGVVDPPGASSSSLPVLMGARAGYLSGRL